MSLYFSNTYTVSSRSDKRFLQRKFGKLSAKVVIRPNWVKDVDNKSLERRHKNKIICVGRLENQKNFEELFSMYADGKINPEASDKFTLDTAADAIAHLANRKAKGKVVINF